VKWNPYFLECCIHETTESRWGTLEQIHPCFSWAFDSSAAALVSSVWCLVCLHVTAPTFPCSVRTLNSSRSDNAGPIIELAQTRRLAKEVSTTLLLRNATNTSLEGDELFFSLLEPWPAGDEWWLMNWRLNTAKSLWWSLAPSWTRCPATYEYFNRGFVAKFTILVWHAGV